MATIACWSILQAVSTINQSAHEQVLVTDSDQIRLDADMLRYSPHTIIAAATILSDPYHLGIIRISWFSHVCIRYSFPRRVGWVGEVRGGLTCQNALDPDLDATFGEKKCHRRADGVTVRICPTKGFKFASFFPFLFFFSLPPSWQKPGKAPLRFLISL